MNKIYKTSSELILCGDVNIKYLNDNSRKDLLDSLLASFSLFSTVKFPTRISNNSCTLKDNIYINTYRHEFSVHPIINGLSEHDGQIITLSNIPFLFPDMYFPSPEKSTTNQLVNLPLLSYENWEDVFLETNVLLPPCPLSKYSLACNCVFVTSCFCSLLLFSLLMSLCDSFIGFHIF